MQDVGGEHHGVVLAQAGDQLADLDDLLGIKADSRLIHDDDLGVAHQRLRHAHALLVALGEVADQAMAHIGDLDQVVKIIQMRFLALAAHFLDFADELQVFFYRHIHIQRRQLRQVADAAFGLARLLQDIHSVDQDLSLAGGNIAGNHVHRGALARTVAPQETQNFALVDRKGNIVDRAFGTVTFGYVLKFDHTLALLRPSLRIRSKTFTELTFWKHYNCLL